MGFGQVIRTWFYCGDIGGHDGVAPRYQELNRARRDFYRAVPFLDNRRPEGHCDPVYPASTGIGINGRGIMMSAIGLAAAENPPATSELRPGGGGRSAAWLSRISPLEFVSSRPEGMMPRNKGGCIYG
jgi:hypothetical protein